MPAIDENHGKRHCADRRGNRARRHEQNSNIFQLGSAQGPTQLLQAFHAAGNRIEEIRIVVQLARLMLLRAAMMIHADQAAAAATGARSQVDGRFSAVAADLQNRPQSRMIACQIVQTQTFLVIEKTFAVQRYLMCMGIHVECLRVI